MDPSFELPPEYFYALGATIPLGVSASDRLALATQPSELALAIQLQEAIDEGLIPSNPGGMAPLQAARRLTALGGARVAQQSAQAAPNTYTVRKSDKDVYALIEQWLAAPGPANWAQLPEPDASVWHGLLLPTSSHKANDAAQLRLLACALTGWDDVTLANPKLTDFVKAIKQPLGVPPGHGGLKVSNADELAGVSASRWTEFLTAHPEFLPEFTQPPGTTVATDDRISAFLRYLARFYTVAPATPELVVLEPDSAPLLDRYGFDPLASFLAAYDGANAPPYRFGTTSPSSAASQGAAAAVFPTDQQAQQWLLLALDAVGDLVKVTAGVVPGASANAASLEFSIVEALYARGLTSIDSIVALDESQFAEALTGSVAFQWASPIWVNAGGKPKPPAPASGGFKPVDPAGQLRDCIPPPELSPLGPVQYLRELLDAGPAATCAEPQVAADSFGSLLSTRRGDLGSLQVTAANLQTPLPVLDLVNECLEHLVAEVLAAGGSVSGVGGVVYDTAAQALRDHLLRAPDSPPEPGEPYHHDPATLFAALPEHSSPASPVAQPAAYAELAGDYGAPDLPYSQPLDVARSHLGALRSTRYETLRRFRAQITEFVLGGDPVGFDTAVWRYPVRRDIAPEYLDISAAEYQQLFVKPIITSGAAKAGQLTVWQLYCFPSPTTAGKVPWTTVVADVSEFLRRTALSYCEFIELCDCGFLQLRRAGAGQRQSTFDECEPCHLDGLTIDFGPSAAVTLMKLAVFIRLWRLLARTRCARYSFAELADICLVLGLFNGATINPDFIPELVAFQILRDELCLPLRASVPPAGATGVARTPLLALWVEPNVGEQWEWAVNELLERLREHTVERHGRDERAPELIKIPLANLDLLSRLAGFDPAAATDTWHHTPTRTLRFVEVLAKVGASRFTSGDLEFLFTVQAHLPGEDPFPLQTDDDALDDPLGLPEDDDRDSLWDLRRELLAAQVHEHELEQWTWPRIDAWLREELGYHPGGGPDRLTSLAEHAFPGVLERVGHPVLPADRRYSVGLALANTTPGMWNSDPHSPILFDNAHLNATLPLSNRSVLELLARIRQLNATEAAALRDLYWLPRVDLAAVSFLFSDPAQADRQILQERDERERWRYFRRHFLLTHRRCEIIARHLARNGGGDPDDEDTLRRAWLVLKGLYADENFAKTPWESAQPSGAPPQVTWPNPPTGGAFAALLGLCGTGVAVDYTAQDGQPIWSAQSGALEAFGEVEDRLDAPLPTLIPAIDPPAGAQSGYVELRNGFAFDERDQNLGGAEGFSVTFTGVLLVEHPGRYRFAAGAPTPDGEHPSIERAGHSRWQVKLERGQREWLLLSHNWADRPNTEHEAELELRRGAYDITVTLQRPEPEFEDRDQIDARHAGFEVKYAGADSDERLIAIPHRRLFIAAKDPPQLAPRDPRGTSAAQVIAGRYTSSLRDVRRTYQRALKAVLLATRFELSAYPDDAGQSELGFMLAHPARFAGSSYYRTGASFTQHRAQFDFNFLPLLDNYHPPNNDDRADPSPQRQAALFDWWERLFDYTQLRHANRREHRHARRARVWRLFAAAAAANPGEPLQLEPHLDVPLDHNEIVQRYFGLNALLGQSELTARDLLDERWAIRAWKAEMFLRGVQGAVYATPTQIAETRPDLWAADDPAAGALSGNDNLTLFVGDSLLENGDPRRYHDLAALDDGLRERARRALQAFLCAMDRVRIAGGPPPVYATTPDDLSDLLLLDVRAGACERASRIDDAITAVQAFVERALMRLEPGIKLDAAFRAVWEGRLKTFRTWQACKRRELYPENTIECDELERARGDEAFALLETELRDAALSIPVAAGIQQWDDRRPPRHHGLAALQVHEPSTLHLPISVPPASQPLDAAVPAENFGLLGRPDRAAQPSWLSPLDAAPQPTPVLSAVPGKPRKPATGAKTTGDTRLTQAVARPIVPAPDVEGKLPHWILAAIDLGVRFLRIAAAGEPSGASTHVPRDPGGPCCCECGQVHPPCVDEYYFWLAPVDYYDLPEAQDAGRTNAQGGSQWEDPKTFPALLDWEANPMVNLHWCRIHNGELGQLRRSDEGVALDPSKLGTIPGPPTLKLLGRLADSLVFGVDAWIMPEFEGGSTGGSFPWEPPYAGWPVEGGWRYDIATDEALQLPLVKTPPAPSLQPPGGPPLFGGLAAYPFFLYATPGEPVIPLSPFAPALAVAGVLRCHCHFDDALRWYERYYDPLESDNTWTGPSPTPAVARKRAVLLDVLDTLLCWGDAVMVAHSDCGRPGGNAPEAFAKSRVIYDAAARILGATPTTVLLEAPAQPPATVASYSPMAPPLNPRLMTLYERVHDRLALLRSCENRQRRRYPELGRGLSFWGDDPAQVGQDDGCGCGVCAACAACDCCDAGLWCQPNSPYRFEFLSQKALELAGEVRAFGAALLAAFEKGDAEYLASLRATQEHQLQELTLAIRKDQWRDADWQVQALGKARLSAQNQLAYYTLLIQNGLNADEILYQDLTGVAIGLQITGQALEFVAQTGGTIPDVFVGEDNFIKIPMTGAGFTNFFDSAAKAAGFLAQDSQTGAGLALTEASWDRRLADWQHQTDIFTFEIERLEREILGADRRSDMALRELNNQQRQIEQTREVEDFLRDKFSNVALYLYDQRHTANLYRELYELALAFARQAQRAFNIERGHTDQRFVGGELWDDLHEGLLAGERLELDLRRMEKAYRDCNRREYELTKHISLQRELPLAFLQLKATGHCEIELPEWMFDLDYPGQFMRRIKNVSLSIPCVTGPYTGVHCRLTLLSSSTRTQPWLHGPVSRCCHEEHEVCDCCDCEGADDETEGYRPIPGDSRIVRSFAATEAIATSSGVNDTGLFELSFRDERYLPFEFAGAVSRWRIELPPENNRFDFDSLTDVVLHLNYTSREGGEQLRRAASAAACCHLPGDGLRLFDVRHEFPDAWPSLRARHDEDRHGEGRHDHERHLELRFVPAMFPFLPGRRAGSIGRLALVFAAPDADPGHHHIVRFRREGEDRHHAREIECVATGTWSGFFYGVIDLRERPLGPLDSERGASCTLEFPAGAREICSAYVIASYDGECWPRCGPPRGGECCGEG